MTKKAIIYARVSDRKQVESELSIPAQIEKCTDKAHSLGADVDRVFVDEGISASSDARPGFIGAIEYCELMSPEFMIIWSSSRFARNRMDAALYKHRLDIARTKLIYLTMPVDRDTMQGRLMDGIFEIFDEHKSMQTSVDTKRSLIQNAKKGYWNGGKIPFGFYVVPDKINPKKKRLEINESEARIIKKIFDKRAEGFLGARGITDWLNNQGYSNRNKRWTKSTIANLLRNHSVIGQMTFDKRDRVTGRIKKREEWVIVDAHNPIITKELWNTVQLMMDKDFYRTESSSPKSQFSFTGMLKCGICGGSITTCSGTGRSKTYHYYVCGEAKDKSKHRFKRIPAADFDTWLIDQLSGAIFTREALQEVLNETKKMLDDWSRDRHMKRMNIQNEITSTQSKIDKLYELFELHGKDTPGLSDLTKRLRRHNQIIEQCEHQLADLNASSAPSLSVCEDDISDLSNFLTGTLKKTDNIKFTRSFFSAFIDEIKITSDRVHIEYKPEYLFNMNRILVRSTSNWLLNLGSNQGQTD